MKKTHVFTVALTMVYTVCMVVAAAAPAVVFSLAEWLVNGDAVDNGVAVLVSNELTFEDTKVPLTGKAAVLCKYIVDGALLPDGAGLLESVLNSVGDLISKVVLTEPGLACTNVIGCPEPLAYPVTLPWSVLLEVMEDTTNFIVELLLEEGGKGDPGWGIACHGVANLEDICHAPETVGEVKSEVGGAVFAFSEVFAELAGVKLMTCSQGGVEAGIVETRSDALGSIVGASDETVTASAP